MPLIQVSMAAGRSDEQIRQLIHELTEVTMRVANAPAEAVHIVISEVAHDHWATGDVTIAEKRAQASS
jgi:4-oxalocrotonate tautomerase